MEAKQFKERINYVKDTCNGKEILIASPVNYPALIYQADSVKELLQLSKEFIKDHLEYCLKEINQEDPVELKEMSIEEFEKRNDNIDYWEMERILRILNRPTVQEKWLDIITKVLNNENSSQYTTAEEIYHALSTQDIEQYSNNKIWNQE